jgi:hypothetical protein
MAAQPNCMFFAPTALDTVIQNAYGATGANPLALVNTALTRTSNTVNTIAGFTYQGDLRDVLDLTNLVANLYSKR